MKLNINSKQIKRVTTSSISSLINETKRINPSGTSVVYLPDGETSGSC